MVKQKNGHKANGWFYLRPKFNSAGKWANTRTPLQQEDEASSGRTSCSPACHGVDVGTKPKAQISLEAVGL